MKLAHSAKHWGTKRQIAIDTNLMELNFMLCMLMFEITILCHGKQQCCQFIIVQSMCMRAGTVPEVNL